MTRYELAQFRLKNAQRRLSLPVVIAWLIPLVAVVGCAQYQTDSPDEYVGTVSPRLYSDVVGLGPLNGVEWQIDAPWRVEPISELNPVYDPIPITVTFHDVRSQDSVDQEPFPFKALCGLYVLESRGENISAPRRAVTFMAPQEFHEIEASRRWLVTGELTPGSDSHLLRRIWAGDAPDDVQNINDWAEWHGTALYQPSGAVAPGDDLRLIILVRVSSGSGCPADLEMTSDQLLWQLMRGRASSLDNDSPFLTADMIDPEADSFFFGDFLKVHYAEQPLPRFDSRWAYGDLHYHSQGTDNEGESAINFRGVLQAMKAMGLDYVFATDHASNSLQITGFHQIFVDDIPGIPSLLSFIEDFLIDLLKENKIGFPVTRTDAQRDLSPQRFRYLHDWLNRIDGANAEVTASGGSPRAPRIFLGGEVDVIPEISTEEKELGWFRYARDRIYNWSAACVELPSAVLKSFDFEEQCEGRLSYDGSTPDQWAVRDPQGLGKILASRQHMVHLPYDSTAPGASTEQEAFIPSNTTEFGGANRNLGTVLHEELDVAQKGYVFLAHPVDAASGSGVNRFGPDMVPYSDTQLSTAFDSEYVLGLQLWNSDTRHSSEADSRKFPMLHGQGRPEPEPEGEGLVQVSFDWRWETLDELELLESLRDGTQMWDQVLRWGINPARTADVHWLADGAPRKFFMAGGSDAHGDLNYRRRGRFFGWADANDTAIGKPRNLTYVGFERAGGQGAVGQNQVVDALRSGHFSVTDGPALRIAIDVNNNGVIDDADVPMGGNFTITGETAPVLVEWKSTAEFGPVMNVDFYVGIQSGDHEGLVYAPAAHGALGSGQCIESVTPVTDATGREYCPMLDGYVRDPNGNLRVTVPRAEGFAGTRRFVLNPNEYSVFNHECVTENDTIRGDDGEEIPISITRCHATDVQPPARLYVRAFAETEGQGAFLRRYAFTNPIWMDSRQVASPPSVRLEHVSCTSGTNTFTAMIAPGLVPADISSPQFRISSNGAWRTLRGNTITTEGAETVFLRARACNESGCSDFATTSLRGPTCTPPPPSPPRVLLEHAGCSSGTNSFVTSAIPTGSIPTTSMEKQFRIDNGTWRVLSSPVIRAGSRQKVGFRARACSANGCSSYASTSLVGPLCGSGGTNPL